MDHKEIVQELKREFEADTALNIIIIDDEGKHMEFTDMIPDHINHALILEVCLVD